MPILVPGTLATDAQLAQMLQDHREAIEEFVRRAEAPTGKVDAPLSLRTVADLGRDLLVLCDVAARPETPRPLREAIVDVSYDGMLALIDLTKSHTDAPKVPRPSRASS
ncbi:MAG TPA: hypothetical protein VGV89_05355 [Thermoplasmata archaeon]|nr:hypothetical protein [Thermoplasmata archaeon]